MRARPGFACVLVMVAACGRFGFDGVTSPDSEVMTIDGALDGASPDGAPPDGDVTTPMLQLVAGQLGGLGSADGTAAAVRFNDPRGVTFDQAGNLYVADTFNSIIRKVALSTGAVTTLAVTTPGVSGIASDGADNLYLANAGDHTIRRIVVSTGAATTLAGTFGASGGADGTGAAARFNAPSGVAIDGGVLHVADPNNHTIRSVVIATGVVTTLAGTATMPGSADGTGAAARFDHPRGLVSDGAGNLYVTDTDNHTIRKIVIATRVVTTLAGGAGVQGSSNGTGTAARFTAPAGVTADGAGNLYITDTGNFMIRKLVIATGVVTTLAGSPGTVGQGDGIGTAAGFDGPSASITDEAGNLYVADFQTIRKIAIATGTVITLAGVAARRGNANGIGSAARFDSPYGAAIDGAGDLYLSDRFSGSIRKVVISTGLVTTLAGGGFGSTDGVGLAARFNFPQGVASDGAGNLYVADSSNFTIRAIVISTGAVITLAGTAGMTGSTDGIGAAARFAFPDSLAADGAGNLYVADHDGHTIRKIVIATAAVSTLAGTASAVGNTDGTGAAARFNSPRGLAVDGGNLYVADYGNSAIRKIVIATGAVTTLAGTFDVPHGVGVDGAGNLYVSDTGSSTIRKIVLATGASTTPVGVARQAIVAPGTLPAKLNSPMGISCLPGGKLVIVDASENVVLIANGL